MQECVSAGIRTDGILPGGLNVKRRAKAWHDKLRVRDASSVERRDLLDGMEWVNLFALAVNEENAAGNRVVTAPTNGAAGIIPAVMHYVDKFVDVEQRRLPWAIEFLLVAGAIGIIIKSKFGSLDYYAYPSPDGSVHLPAFDEAILAASWASIETCEECGSPAKQYTIQLWT